jgi:hypothetical protein
VSAHASVVYRLDAEYVLYVRRLLNETTTTVVEQLSTFSESSRRVTICIDYSWRASLAGVRLEATIIDDSTKSCEACNRGRCRISLILQSRVCIARSLDES